jgi:hypothetical protein
MSGRLLLAVMSLAAYTARTENVKALSGSLEVMWDMDRIAGLDNARLTLHPPKLREVAVVHDRPWEGNVCCYHTVFQDGPLYRMYYRGANWGGTSHPEVTCYAESDDGIVWRKPALGLFAFDGSASNNIVWQGDGSHNFAPFRDNNPNCPPGQRYKALGGDGNGLFAFVSADGIRWQKLRPEQVITLGAFDSQNLAFWDASRGLYVDYHRHFTNGVRAVMTCTSTDFVNWTEPQWLVYEEGTPVEHLYTNAIQPYPRAPCVYIGFPKRLLPDRTTRFDTSGAGGLSDGVFMSSRDGLLFKRWREAFLCPGPQHERWVNRNNMIAWGVVEAAPEFPGAARELSLYSTENYYSATPTRLRRMTVRQDGFVSVRAEMAGGTATTRPLTFTVPADPYPCPEALRGAVPVRTDLLSGLSALRVNAPSVFTLPGTSNLGARVTLAVGFSNMPAGHRRLFSAYAGGANTAGARRLVFDLMAGGSFADGTAVRFWYDGVSVGIPAASVPDWNTTSRGKMHLAATYDDGVVAVYVNGVERARGGAAGAGALRPALGDIRFGEDYPPAVTTNEAFLGLADDITVVGRALGAGEIAAAGQQGMLGALLPATDTGVFFDMEGDTGAVLSNKLNSGAAAVVLPGSLEWGDAMLLLNASTSAAGSIRCEIRDAAGQAVPGFTLAECKPLYGDEIELPVVWKNGAEVGPLAGQALTLHFELKDADLYAYRFGQPAKTEIPAADKQFVMTLSKQ